MLYTLHDETLVGTVVFLHPSSMHTYDRPLYLTQPPSCSAIGMVWNRRGGENKWRPLKGTEGWSFRVEYYKELQDRFFGSDRLAKTGPIHRATGRTSSLRWMAADVATSIQLGPNKFLWLFGDTFVGKNVSLSQWVEPAGVHAFPRQTIGEDMT